MPDFRYIAYDADTQLPLAHDARAVYALQRADSINEAARIFTIDAGALGLEIWTRQLTLPEAEALILGHSDGARES